MHHDAFVYGSGEEFLSMAVPYVEAGLDANSPTIAVHSRLHNALLRDVLGDSAREITFVDHADWYVRPMTALSGYHGTVRGHLGRGAKSVRVVAEIMFGPEGTQWSDWIDYEAILSHSFAGQPVDIHCGYDQRVLPEDVVDDAVRAHDPSALMPPLPTDPSQLAGMRELSSAGDPLAIRERIAGELNQLGVHPARTLDALVAINELLTNAFEHAGGPAAVRVGAPGGAPVVEIEDRGPGLDDPLVGYTPPDATAGRGGGLWIARRLSSRLELFSSAGVTARLWL